MLAFLFPFMLGLGILVCAVGAYVFDANEIDESSAGGRSGRANLAPQRTGEPRGNPAPRPSWLWRWVYPTKRVKPAFWFIVLGTFAALFFPPALWSAVGADPHLLARRLGVICAAASGLFLVLTIGFLVRRQDLGREVRRQNAELLFKAAEIAVLVLGIAFAVHTARTAIKAVDKNTDSNLLAARAQIYEADNQITILEMGFTGNKLSSLYAGAFPEAATAEEARRYIRDLLGMVTSDKRILDCQNVDQLAEAIFGRGSFRPADQPEDPQVADLRKMMLHCTLLLNTLHGAFDNLGVVLDYEEFNTWAGYFTDVGPHPVFLASIRAWETRSYMSREFALEVRKRFWVTADPATRRVVEAFYPDMTRPDFGSHLPSGYSTWDPSNARRN